MSVDISKSLDGLFYDFTDVIQVDKAILGDRMAEFLTPASVKGCYIVEGTNVYINSYISVDIIFKCDKCLDKVDKALNIKFDVTYSLTGSDTGDYEYNNFMVDFTEAVNEQIMLNVPSRVLCKNDCKGLCTVCGAKLNESQCSCIIETVEKESPFSALKKYFNE